MTKVIVLDTETTGGSNKDQIIELAHVELHELSVFRTAMVPYKEESFFTQRYMPSVPINPMAFECHGISYKELLGKPKSETVKLPEGVEFIVGHNIAFDHRFLGKPEVKLICTLDLSRKMAKHLELDFPSHKLSDLVHLWPENPVTFNDSKYHSAHDDILKNIIVLQELLKKLPNISSWQNLYDFQQSMKTPSKGKKK